VVPLTGAIDVPRTLLERLKLLFIKDNAFGTLPRGVDCQRIIERARPDTWCRTGREGDD